MKISRSAAVYPTVSRMLIIGQFFHWRKCRTSIWLVVHDDGVLKKKIMDLDLKMSKEKSSPDRTHKYVCVTHNLWFELGQIVEACTLFVLFRIVHSDISVQDFNSLEWSATNFDVYV